MTFRKSAQNLRAILYSAVFIKANKYNHICCTGSVYPVYLWFKLLLIFQNSCYVIVSYSYSSRLHVWKRQTDVCLHCVVLINMFCLKAMLVDTFQTNCKVAIKSQSSDFCHSSLWWKLFFSVGLSVECEIISSTFCIKDKIEIGRF